MPDQTIFCEDCQEAFVHTESEQTFFALKKFKTPKRCKACREVRKTTFESQKGDGKRMTCESCDNTFIWSKKDQAFYATNDFVPPRHCRTCREKRKKSRERNKRRETRKPRRSNKPRTDARAYLES